MEGRIFAIILVMTVVGVSFFSHSEVKASDYFVWYTYGTNGHCDANGYWVPLIYTSVMPKNSLVANSFYLNGAYLASGSGIGPTGASGRYESGSGYIWQPSPWPYTPPPYTVFLDQRYMTSDYVTYEHLNWLLKCNKDGSVSITISYLTP